MQSLEPTDVQQLSRFDPARRPFSTFLIGGGRDHAAAVAVHARWVSAIGTGTIACVVADEGDVVDSERWRGLLADAGASDVEIVVVSATQAPSAKDLAGVAGVYVAGGLTPLYAAALARVSLPAGVAYAGYSAGAAVAASRAIVGGWRSGGVDVCPEDAGEDLDELTVVDGLGLVPFTVDVHASQWGTLSRLVHAVRRGLVDEGIAIDEHTAVETAGGEVTGVWGTGSAYRVTAGVSGDVSITVLRGADAP